MKERKRLLWLLGGMVLGVVATVFTLGPSRQAEAATHDRHEDFIMCTGPVSLFPLSPVTAPLDGVWLLDYKAGKLLATVVDRSILGKIISWAEVDLVTEFGIQPKQNVHFMMVTGTITAGQAALYLTETTTGKFAVYTLQPRPDGRPGVSIVRHDMVLFRQPRS